MPKQIDNAFSVWQDVSALKFEKVSNESEADIKIFGGGDVLY